MTGRPATGTAAALADASEVARILGDLHSGEDLDLIDDLDDRVRDGVRLCQDVSAAVEAWRREAPESDCRPRRCTPICVG